MKARWIILPLTALLFMVSSAVRSRRSRAFPPPIFTSRPGRSGRGGRQEIDGAGSRIVVHAHSFPSYEIAKALAEARERGVMVVALLDRSQKREKETTAFVLEKAESRCTSTATTPWPTAMR